eukprot:TRINITY_DN8989_c0_g1_i1.p1 TRINITY_DN8989_c0_g1~~TRINITY_DN8989_c0_g1_i1.p1  ORF type:complete len:489 (+),score=103.89 TRINITY_DN8989_c0_g1_i1:140-1606(+)
MFVRVSLVVVLLCIVLSDIPHVGSVSIRTTNGSDGRIDLPSHLAEHLPSSSVLRTAPSASSYNWTTVDQVLQEGITEFAYPGCTAMVGTQEGIIYSNVFGNFTYSNSTPPLNNGTNPGMRLDTVFDMASCSKVVGATTALAQFYQRGELDLDTPIQKFLGSNYTANGKENITVRNCLLHNAGYPPDPDPNYWSTNFTCPATTAEHPAEVYTCQVDVWNSLMNQTLQNPVGEVYVYSDLSFITLMYVVGNLARTNGYITPEHLLPGCDNGLPQADQCYFEAYVRLYVFGALGLENSTFLPPREDWAAIPPTWNDTTYMHEVMQGTVSDGNAYALGGISGHAGIFSNAPDMFTFMTRLMYASEDDKFLNATTVKYFTTEYNHSQSSRALGWNTNDPTVFDEGWNTTCGTLSPLTFTHIGFTGTQLCGDPTRQLFTVFLTNRVYPDEFNFKIEKYRRNFNSAVRAVFDGDVPRLNTGSDGTAAEPWRAEPC